MIKFIYRSIRDKKASHLKTPKKGAWVFAYDLTADDISALQNMGLDKDILEDALDYFEVPRFEYFNNITYLFTRFSVHHKTGELSTAPLLIAISENHIFTITHKKPYFLDDFAHGRRNLYTTQKVKSLLTILDTIVLEYDTSLLKIRKELIRYFGKLEKVSEVELKNLLSIETTLADYISAMNPTHNALTNMLLRHNILTLRQEDIEILEDLNQDIKQSIETAKNIAKTAQNIRSAHDVILGHQLNTTMKTLTALTIIFTIPTIMTGLFGMNTWLPLPSGPESFFIIIVITAIISFLTAKIFARKGWI